MKYTFGNQFVQQFIIIYTYIFFSTWHKQFWSTNILDQKGSSRGCSTNTFATDQLINWWSHPYPPNLQNIITPIPLELRTWNFYPTFAVLNVSCVLCHMPHVNCHVLHITKKCIYIFFLSFSGQRIGGIWWRVCYYRGLPRIVLIVNSQDF